MKNGAGELHLGGWKRLRFLNNTHKRLSGGLATWLALRYLILPFQIDSSADISHWISAFLLSCLKQACQCVPGPGDSDSTVISRSYWTSWRLPQGQWLGFFNPPYT